MKKQVFVIHGGTAFGTYDEYIAYLRGKAVDLAKLLSKDWKDTLQKFLGEDFEVYFLKMPNSQDAKYLEWAIWFEKYIPFMNDGVILVGHSLGAVFLARYLSENTFPKCTKGVFLVAAPYEDDEGRKLPEFAITGPLARLGEQVKNLFFYHSKDDPVVPFSELARYQKELPEATYRIFDNRLHFNAESFPEIVEDIKGVGKE